VRAVRLHTKRVKNGEEGESVYKRDNLIKRANGNLSHKTSRSQTGSLRVEGSEGGGTYN